MGPPQMCGLVFPSRTDLVAHVDVYDGETVARPPARRERRGHAARILLGDAELADPVLDLAVLFG